MFCVHENDSVSSPGVVAGEMEPEQLTGNFVAGADVFLAPPLFPDD